MDSLLIEGLREEYSKSTARFEEGGLSGSTPNPPCLTFPPTEWQICLTQVRATFSKHA